MTDDEQQAIPLAEASLALAYANQHSDALRIESTEQLVKLLEEFCFNKLAELAEAAKTVETATARLEKAKALFDAGVEFFITKYSKLAESDRMRIAVGLRHLKITNIDTLQGTLMLLRQPNLRGELFA